VVDRDLLVEGARNLRDYFQSRGYPEVDVTFRELPVVGDQQTIEYFISRGPRQTLARVEIAGNKYFDKDTIRERLLLAAEIPPLPPRTLQRGISKKR